MDIRKLQRAIVDGLEDVKAQNIAVFNTEHLSPLFERVIIASGTSNRQTKALASSVRETVKSRGMPVLRTEGEDNGEWIIVDCGAAVAHIMQPAIRDYYHLEELWGGKSVRLKLGDGKAGLPKAAEPEPAPASARKASTATPSRKTAGATGSKGGPQASPKTGPKTGPKTSARSAGQGAPKTAAKTATKAGVKSAAQRTRQAQPAAARTGAARPPAARSQPAGKTPAGPRAGTARKSPPRRG